MWAEGLSSWLEVIHLVGGRTGICVLMTCFPSHLFTALCSAASHVERWQSLHWEASGPCARNDWLVHSAVIHFGAPGRLEFPLCCSDSASCWACPGRGGSFDSSLPPCRTGFFWFSYLSLSGIFLWIFPCLSEHDFYLKWGIKIRFSFLWDSIFNFSILFSP